MNNEVKEKKPKSLPLYLTDEQRSSLQKKASSSGFTLNGYIKMLINKDLEK